MCSFLFRRHHAPIYFGLIYLISSTVLAYDAEKNVPNTDRVQCMRQDNLDLVIPSMTENIIRQVVAVSDDSTKKDVYVSVTDIEINKISAVVVLKRGPNNTFKLEVSGTETFGEYNDVAVADLTLTGVGILTEDSLIALGAKILPGYTTAQLYFKLNVEGKAIYNETTAEWNLELLDKEKPKPFQFKLESEGVFDSRKIIQKVLNDYASIDDLIIQKGLWPAAEQLMPVAFIASFNFLTKDEFGPEVRATVSGRQTGPHTPLHLDMTMNVMLDVVPGALLQVLLDNFDPKAIAEQKLEKILNIEDLHFLVEENKPALIATLARYGVPAELIEEKVDPELIRAFLIQKAKESADEFTKSLRPLVKRYEKGEIGLFEGYQMDIGLATQWDLDVNHGMTSSRISCRECDTQSNWFVLPLENYLAVPWAKGQETVGEMRDVQYQSGKFNLSNLQVRDFRVVKGGENGTARQTYKFSFKVRDVYARVPPAWDPGFVADWDLMSFTIAKNGTISISGGNRGIEIKQVRRDSELLGTESTKPTAGEYILGMRMRSGSSTSLDGKIPEEFMRATQNAKTVKRTELITKASLDGAVEAVSGEMNTMVRVTAKAYAKVNMEEELRRLLSPRSSEDFGYAFATQYVTRNIKRRQKSGSYVLESSGTTVAVVSCGYLRLLDPVLLRSSLKEPLKRILMPEPKKEPRSQGQYEMDLAIYEDAPEIYSGSNDELCINLHSSGYKPRERYVGFFSSNEVLQEELCGPSSKIMHLGKAIELQIKRFRTNRALSSMWNYGTHPAEQWQYSLEKGKEARNLMEILQEQHKDILVD